jgi:hypothetical protein
MYSRLGGADYYVFRITGPLKGEGARFSILVAGREVVADAYHSFFFHRSGHVEQLKPVRGIRLAHAAFRVAQDTDDIVLWESWWWQKRSGLDHLAFEAWSNAMILLQERDIEAFLKANVSSMILRRIKQYRKKLCDVEISTTDRDLEIFYQEFYKPLLENRHGRNAHGSSLELLQSFGGGSVDKKIMFLSRNGERIAAMLLLHDRLESCLTIQEYGVVPSLLGDAKGFQTLYAGMNYSAINWALTSGISKVSFGGAQNQLSNGVYFYKKQWGAVFERNREREPVCLKFISAQQILILSAFPLLYFDRKSPCGILALLPDDTLPQQNSELAKKVKAFACRNMSLLRILVPQPRLSEFEALDLCEAKPSNLTLDFVGYDPRTMTLPAKT